jgi:hypothetical protein
MAVATPGSPAYRALTVVWLLKIVQQAIPWALVVYVAWRHGAWSDPVPIVGVGLCVVVGVAWRAILRRQVRKLGPPGRVE